MQSPPTIMNVPEENPSQIKQDFHHLRQSTSFHISQLESCRLIDITVTIKRIRPISSSV